MRKPWGKAKLKFLNRSKTGAVSSLNWFNCETKQELEKQQKKTSNFSCIPNLTPISGSGSTVDSDVHLNSSDPIHFYGCTMVLYNVD